MDESTKQPMDRYLATKRTREEVRFHLRAVIRHQPISAILEAAMCQVRTHCM